MPSRFPRAPEVLRRAVRKNAALKLLALAMAAALWWYVAGESKVQVGFAVPLEIRNLPAGTSIVNKVDRQVEVHLAGPPSLLGNMAQSEVCAAIDLTGARIGRQVMLLDTRAVKVPPGVRVQRIYPSSVEIDLGRMMRRRLPVAAKVGGTPATRRRVARVEVKPATLEVEALEGDFAKLTRLETEVVIPEGPEEPEGPYESSARVELREGHARIVGSPEVRVTVHFRR